MLRKLVRNNSMLFILKPGIFTNCRECSKNSSTIDKNELQHFEQLSRTWWDKNGPLQPLHAMNKIRVPFIVDNIMGRGRNSADHGKSPKSLKDVKLLDVGCGGGILSEALAELGMNVTGIDAAEDLIKIAKRHASQKQSLQNLSYAFTTIEEYSLKRPNYFDAIVASEIVEHVSDIKIFVAKCISCLKPGGSIIITTINKTIVSRMYVIYILESLKLIPPGTHSYEKLVPPSLLQTILEENSCSVMQIQGTWYDLKSKAWSLTNNTSTFYSLHAVKNI